MKCPHCMEALARISKAGDPMIRNAGLLLKADGIAVVCPGCKQDVAIGGDVLQQLRRRLVLIPKTVSRADSVPSRKVVTAS